MTAIGVSAVRSDAALKVTGAADYTVDVVLPGMLHCVVVRSPIAAGRIVGLDVSAAERSPGVRAIVTAADQPAHTHGIVVRDQVIFARDEVRHEGEVIAAIAADTLAEAQRAAALVVLELEPVAPVVDLDAAVTAGSRLVHPEWQRYDIALDMPRSGNVAGELLAEPDGVDEAFASAAHVVEDRFDVGRQYQAYLEVKSVVAEFRGGRHIIHVSHQFPFAVRDRLAEALGVRLADVRVVGHHIGGGFGAKLDLGIEPYAAMLAQATGRPVKLVLDRTEDMITCPSRENAVLRIRTAVDHDGELLAREFDVLLDAGAYATDTPLLCSIAMLGSTGAYRVGPTRVRARAVYTNTAPTGAFRGVSGAAVTFAVERHLDHIAATVGIDRDTLRRRALLRSGGTMTNGQVLSDADILGTAFDTIDRLASQPVAAHAPKADGALRGVGQAALVWLTNPLPGEATLRLTEDGTLRLATGATDNGSGAVTTGLRQIAAEQLGLRPDDVVIGLPDTDVHGWDGGSQGSRTTHIVGRAIADAGTELRAKICDIAADLLEADRDDLEVVNGAVGVRGVPGSRVALREIATVAAGTIGSLAATASYTAPPVAYLPGCASGLLFTAYANPTYHAHQAEVEVDPITGNVRVLRYLVAQEVGRAINPTAVRGQIQGGVTQGIGYALSEAIDIGDDGRYRQRTLEAYRLPIATDIPTVEFELLEHPNPNGPFGAKGVAEPPLVPVAAAIANAVSDAIGHPITRLPIRPEDVLAGIAAAAATKAAVA
jgi:CO/xanthine dehydrogenase Mo-binding subunit